MAYSNFAFATVKKMFALRTVESETVFSDDYSVEPSATLAEVLGENLPLAIAIGSEKARSELIIAPILVEVRKILKRRVSLFLGAEFNVDIALGLNGVCDFIFSNSPEQLAIEAPVLMMVEAKKAELNLGMGQVVAEMVAAQMFNRHNNSNIEQVYGCVTSGTQWRFLCLEEQKLTIELRDRDLNPLNRLLGILIAILSN